MQFRRTTAAVFAACCLVVPVVHAQDAVQASVTAYATGGDGGAVGSVTASGVPVHWGTVAADWRLYPPGTRLQIEGFPDDVFVVEDSGGAVRGNIIDIWFPDLASAEAFGMKTLRVTVLPAP